MFIPAATVHVAQATASIQATGIFDWINDKTAQTQTAIQGILIVLGLLVAIIISWRGKNVGSVIMGVVIGGLIAALPALIMFFAGAAQQETTATGTSAAAGQVAAYAQAAVLARA